VTEKVELIDRSIIPFLKFYSSVPGLISKHKVGALKWSESDRLHHTRTSTAHITHTITHVTFTITHIIHTTSIRR